MGITKKELFTDEDLKLVELFKALSNPARLTIVKFLLNIESCFSGDIVNEIPLSQSTVSQHLKELKKAGIIKGRTQGKNVSYCINAENWNKYENHLMDLFENKIEILDC